MGQVFFGRIPKNIMDLKLGIRPEQATIPTSQIAQGVLDQTQMIYQEVRRNTMQAYIKYEAYCDKKAEASQLKEAEYVYVLQPRAYHQGIKILFTEFRWIGPCIYEKVLPNNNYLVRKIDTNRTQMLQRIRMRQFTAHQPPPDIRITPQKWKPDPEVSLKHDELYARVWECEYEKPIIYAKNDKAMPPNSSQNSKKA